MTIGERISSKVEEYWRIYQVFKKDPVLCGKAKDLALVDLVMGRYVYDEAAKRLGEMIQEDLWSASGGGDGR
jgi:hypothetical protein